MLIDTHAHVTFKEYQNDLEDVIKRSLSSDIKIINASSNYKNSQLAVQLSDKHEGMWALVGCHPIDLTKDFTEKTNFNGEQVEFFSPREEVDFEKYKDLVNSSKKVVGIGEVGLDFFRMAEQELSIEQIKELQVEKFKGFIELAQEVDLPLVLHCRGEADDPYGAYDLMLEILKNELGSVTASPGVIHCYGGNLEQAKKFIDSGFYIGITGIVTFKNAKELQEIVKEIALDKILIETDAPFLSPEPHRGERNEPAYVKYVAQKIANLKNISFSEIAKQTAENAKKLFRI